MLAYFGYRQAVEHDTERAINAGPTLTEAVPKLVTNRGSPLRVSVGIATGFAVVGETLNLAAPLHGSLNRILFDRAVDTRRTVACHEPNAEPPWGAGVDGDHWTPCEESRAVGGSDDDRIN